LFTATAIHAISAVIADDGNLSRRWHRRAE